MTKKLTEKTKPKEPHKLQGLIGKVEETHPDLGGLVALCCLVIKSRKLLIVVGAHGTGKSRASGFVGKQAPSSLITDRISVAGLATMAAQVSNFTGAVVVDDIAKTQTEYARINTITTLAELVYSHYVSSHMSKLQFEISNFYGSAIINVQPVLLKSLVASPEWEASVQDKAIRYYHLKRPQNPVNIEPNVKIDWGVDMDKVDEPDLEGELPRELMHKGGQWGLARTREHVSDLARSVAGMDGRTKVKPVDYLLLQKILAPCRYENIVLDKKDFEADRQLDSNRLALLTQYVTYGAFTLEQVADDYHISGSTAYRLMEKYTADWAVVANNPTKYSPSNLLLTAIERAGLNLNHKGVE